VALKVLEIAVETWWTAIGPVLEGLEIRRRLNTAGSEVAGILELLRAAGKSKEGEGREKEGYSRHVDAVSVALSEAKRDC
jgi:hypothetical protein